MTGPKHLTAGVVLSAHSLALALAGRSIIRGLSLTLHPGELVGVIGPNGAGKSTLLRGLAGLLTPSAGAITLDGVALAAVAPEARARAIAYMPQDRTVHWPLTVERVVALGRLPHGGSHAAALKPDGTHNPNSAIETALVDADVTHLRSRIVTTLSGGELARVLLARALAQTPRVLLADEPTAGLDPAHQLALFERLTTLSRSGVAVVVALHDLSLAVRYCSRILLLRDGQTLGLGAPLDVVTPVNLAAAYGIDARVTMIDGVPVVVPFSRCSLEGQRTTA
jgi:iron complex transport system ATP-binding protein